MRDDCGNICTLKIFARCPVRITASQTKGYSRVVFDISIRQTRTLLKRLRYEEACHGLQRCSRGVISPTEEQFSIFRPG